MKGARKFKEIILKANSRKLGDLKGTKLGYNRHGGNAECFRWNDVLFIISSHARGYCFFVYLIDENDDLFEVYGVVGGNRGWTEEYGWIHKGTWTLPILKYLRDLEKEITKYDQDIAEEKRKKEAEQNKAIGEKVSKFNDLYRLENKKIQTEVHA